MEVKLLRVTEEGLDLVSDAVKMSGLSLTRGAEEIVKMITDNDYSSVLEHILFTFDISGISVAVSRELLEHRIASHTARSTRYNEERGFTYHLPEGLRGNERAEAIYREAMKSANEAYTRLRELGIAREDARYVLPLALHTHYVVTMNVRSLINFFMLRLCIRASPEIRELAKRMYKLCVREYPAIFSRIWCRGFTLGVCPENNARPHECPFAGIIPSKQGVKREFEADARRIIDRILEAGVEGETEGKTDGEAEEGEEEGEGEGEERCARCGKRISGDAYEFKGRKLCEECYMDEVIASQPKRCIMR